MMPMNFNELCKARTSIRGYQARPVPEEHLSTILEAARMAPTACNRQPFQLVVIREPERRAAVARAYTKEWFGQAPVIIVLCSEPDAAWTRQDGKNYADVDGAIVMDHITLQAADLELGTCWIGAFDPAILREVLDLPPSLEPLAMTPIGYPDDEGRPKTRKPLDVLVHYEHL